VVPEVVEIVRILSFKLIPVTLLGLRVGIFTSPFAKEMLLSSHRSSVPVIVLCMNQSNFFVFISFIWASLFFLIKSTILFLSGMEDISFSNCWLKPEKSSVSRSSGIVSGFLSDGSVASVGLSAGFVVAPDSGLSVGAGVGFLSPDSGLSVGAGVGFLSPDSGLSVGAGVGFLSSPDAGLSVGAVQILPTPNLFVDHCPPEISRSFCYPRIFYTNNVPFLHPLWFLGHLG